MEASKGGPSLPRNIGPFSEFRRIVYPGILLLICKIFHKKPVGMWPFVGLDCFEAGLVFTLFRTVTTLAASHNFADIRKTSVVFMCQFLRSTRAISLQKWLTLLLLSLEGGGKGQRKRRKIVRRCNVFSLFCSLGGPVPKSSSSVRPPRLGRRLIQ